MPRILIVTGEASGDLHGANLARALRAVAVAAAAEDDGQAPAGQGPQLAEHLLEGVGRVGVVDEHAEVLAALHRLQAAGHGGQVVLSDATKALVDGELGGLGITLRDLGAHHLKDVEGAQHLFQLVIPELPSDFSELRTLETRPNNLPTPPTRLIGRAPEIAHVRDLLLRDDVRCVTLTGPGGAGKSRLGLRVSIAICSLD